MLNEVCKESIASRLIQAMNLEKLTPKEVAAGFGFNSCYVSMIKNKDQWGKCPNKAWETVLAWVNSGDTLHYYFGKHPSFDGRPVDQEVIKEKLQEDKKKEMFKKIMEPIPVTIESDSIKDPLELITAEFDKANSALNKSTNAVYNHDIDIEVHLVHIKNLIPKIQKLQDAIQKLS